MRIAKLPAIRFHDRWWIVPDWLVTKSTVFFMPEESKAISIEQMRGILEEMEKMDGGLQPSGSDNPTK